MQAIAPKRVTRPLRTKITRTIESLRKEGDQLVPFDKQIKETIELPDFAPLILPVVNLSLLRTGESLKRFTELEIIKFARRPTVLQQLKMFAYSWIPKRTDPSTEQNFRAKEKTISSKDQPWEELVDAITMHAATGSSINHDQREILELISVSAKHFVSPTSVHCDFLDLFSDSSKQLHEPLKFTIRLFLAVWPDVNSARHGFFRLLVDSKLVGGIRPEAHAAYEKWYIVDEFRYQQAQTPAPIPVVPAQMFPHIAKETLQTCIATAEKKRQDILATLIGEDANIAKMEAELSALASGGATKEKEKMVTVGEFGCLL